MDMQKGHYQEPGMSEINVLWVVVFFCTEIEVTSLW